MQISYVIMLNVTSRIYPYMQHGTIFKREGISCLSKQIKGLKTNL